MEGVLCNERVTGQGGRCYQIVTIENRVVGIGGHFLGNGRGGCVTQTRR
jgi:hypothetical protein